MGYVRLKDIADKAKVSINTVSRALQDKSDIGEETKRRIRKIADELGYIPNASASHLRTQSKKTIGVVVTHIDNAFYAKILQGINDAIVKSGYTILALSSNEDLERESRMLRTLAANRVAGLLIVPSQDLVSELDYDQLHVPHITIVRKGNLNTQSYFITDSYRSGRLAAEYICSKGRTKPAYIGFHLKVSCNRDRLKGYKEQLKESGIELERGRILQCDSSMEAAYASTVTLMQSHPDTDAIFVYNDQMAMGVLRALYDLKIDIPGRVNVISHDDVEMSEMTIPKLTTIRVPKYSLGYESANALLDLIDQKVSFTKTVVYTPELIERES